MSSQEVPQGYKQTKVGVVPVEWETVRLRDVVKVSQGLQIPISSRFNEPSDNRVFYITIPYVEGKKVEYIEDAKKSVLCTKDDLLVVRTGSGVGKIIKDVEGAFHNNFFKLKFLTDLDTDFIYAFLISPRTQFLMNTYAGSSAIPDLNHGDFYSLDFLLPPLKEQQKIAQILTTWDRAIEKLEALIEEKERLKKGLMQRLLSGEVRFEGFDGEWKFTRLGDLLEYEQPTPYLVANKDYDNRYKTPVLTAGKTFILGYTKEENGIFKENLPVIIFDDFTTATKFVDFPFKVKSSAMKILKAKDETINIKLVFEMMQMINYEADDHKRYWISEFQEIEIKLPPKQEQKKIAQVLTIADKEIELLTKELEELKEQKRGLMQKLLTGEVRV